MSYHELDTPEITIRREGEEPITLNLIGWNKDYTKLYLRSKEGRNRVLPIVHIGVSRKISVFQLEELKWIKPMFPNSDPISILPTRLLPPPCFSQCEGPLDKRKKPNKLESLALLYNIYLYPNQRDKTSIKRQLKKFQKEKKADYESMTEVEKRKQKKKFQVIGIGGEKKFIWELTLDDEIETNATNIRDQHLTQQWLKKENFDLDEMSIDHERFKKLIEIKTKLPDLKSISVNEYLLYLAIQIHYKITFSCGTEFWLFDVKELLAPRSKEETGDIATLASELPEIYTSQEAAKMVGCSLKTIGRYCKDLKVSKAKITDDVISLFKTEKKKRSKRTIINPHKSDDRYS
jgi:hypothetical protein